MQPVTTSKPQWYLGNTATCSVLRCIYQRHDGMAWHASRRCSWHANVPPQHCHLWEMKVSRSAFLTSLLPPAIRCQSWSQTGRLNLHVVKAVRPEVLLSSGCPRRSQGLMSRTSGRMYASSGLLMLTYQIAKFCSMFSNARLSRFLHNGQAKLIIVLEGLPAVALSLISRGGAWLGLALSWDPKLSL